MKVYACPEECPTPQIDYSNYDHDKETAREEKHTKELKEWLIEAGYKGPHTGKIYSTPIADGAALYMVADAKRGSGLSSCLIHLEYGDAYNDPDVGFLPKAEIIRRIKSREDFNKLLAKK